MSIPSLNIEINALINGLQDLANFQQELGNTGSALQSIAPLASQATEGLTNIQGAAGTASSAFGNLGASAGTITTQVGNISTTLNGAAQDLNNLGSTSSNLADVTVDLGSTLEDARVEAELFGGSTVQAAEAAAASLGGLGDTSSVLTDTAQNLGEVGDAAAQASADVAAASAEIAGATGATEDSTAGAADSVNRMSLGFRSFAETAAPETTSRITDLSSGLSDMREQAGSSEGRVQLLGMGLGKVAGLAGLAAGAMIGLIGVINLKEAVEYAARLETMNKVMRAVGTNAGYSAEQLDGYENEITDLGISSIAAKEAIAQMASAGLELGDVSGNGVSQVAELAEAAQNLSIVAGTDASEALSNLIINVKQLDTEGFRSMGITLDQAAAQEQYAEKVGKSSGALTNAEKQQAAMNYVLGEAGKLSGVYAASMDTLEAKLSFMNKAQDNLSATLGQALLPAYKALVSEAATFLGNTEDIVSSNVDIASSSSVLESAVSAGSGAIFDILEGVITLGATIADEVVAIGSGLVEAFASAFNSVKALFTAFSSLNSGTNALEVAFKLISFAVAAIADGFKIVELGVRSFLSVAQTMGAGVLDVLADIASVTDEEVAASIRGMADEMRAGAEANSVAAKQIVDDFAKGDSAVMGFIDGLRGIKKELGEIGTGSTFAELNEDILTLTSAQRQGIITSTDLSENLTKIKDRMAELSKSTALTEAETAKLNGSLAVLAKDIATEFNDAIKNMGLTVASLTSGVSDEVSTISGSLLTLAENAQTDGALFNQAFNFSLDQAGNITELALLTEASKNFAKRVVEGGEAATGTMAQIGEATLLARGKFEELFDSQLGAAKTQKDFEVLTEQVKAFGAQMIEAGLMSEQELEVKLQSIAETAKETAVNLREVGDVAAFDKLGLDIEEVRTGFSSAFNDILEGLNLLNTSSTATSETVGSAFTDIFEGVENVKQLTAIQEKLKEAEASGVLYGTALVEANEAATAKFKEMFTTSLEAANTSKAFTQLREEITAAGDSGVLSAEEVAAAFKKVDDRVKSAGQSVLSMAEQARELSNASLSISAAQTDVLRAQIDSTKADLSYQAALKTYRKDGTEQSRLDLELKKKELLVAQERVELAEIKQQVEEANYDMLIAKQQQLNSEKRLELDIDNASLIAATEAARAEAEAKGLVAAQTQNAYNKQQLVLDATERAALEAGVLADNMRQTTANATSAASAVNGVATAVDEVATAAAKVDMGKDWSTLSIKAWSLEGLQAEVGKYTSDLEEARKLGKEIYEEANAYLKRNPYSSLSNYFAANALLSKQIVLLKEKQSEEDKIAAQQAQLEGEQKARAEELGVITDKALDHAANIIKQAEYLAETGGGINEAYSQAAKGGMTEAEAQIQRLKDGAQDLVKSALDAGAAFMSSTASLEAQLLGAQGKEVELLQNSQQLRRSSLETEYELLKVKLEIARVTAEQAGVDSSALTEMLNKANQAYTRTQDTLTQLETVETERQAQRAAIKASITQQIGQHQAEASLQQQSEQANKGGLVSSSPAQPAQKVNHVITIKRDGMADTEVLADSGNVDNLIKTLQDLKSRSA